MSDVVIQLLERSRSAHQRSIAASRNWDPGSREWSIGDRAAAADLVREALNLRMEAENLDPSHVSPGWSVDVVPSSQLLKFYRAHLGIGATD